VERVKERMVPTGTSSDLRVDAYFSTGRSLLFDSLVVNAEQLEQDLSVGRDDFDAIKKTTDAYSRLKAKRDRAYAEKVSKSNKDVSELERGHYRALAYRNAICRGEHREIFDFLLEMNGLDRRGAFEGTNLRRTYISERQKRLKGRQKLERERRRLRRGSRRRPAVVTEEGCSHYEVLGLEQSASTSTRDIVVSFRQLRPDNARNGRNDAYLQRLKDARDELMSRDRRIAYDRQLLAIEADPNSST